MGEDMDEKLIQDKNGTDKLSSMAAFSTAFNVLLGAGPILVPPVFQQPGIALACIFICIITFISIICAQFVIESMSLLTVIRRRRASSSASQDDNQAFLQPPPKKHFGIINHAENGNWALKEDKPEDFEYTEGIEYGQMGLEIFGPRGQGAVTFIIVTYLIGVLSSKTIMIGSILSKAFSDVSVLDNRNVWIITFFSLSVIFAFRNVQKTKILQSVIIVIRFLTIGSLLVGSIQIMSIKGVRGFNESGHLFNIDNFASFFSDLQFALLMHHAIPSMFANIAKQKDVKKVLYSSIGIGSLSMVLLSILGIFAFGQCLDSTTVAGCAAENYPNGTSYYSNFFKGIANADWVFYISSFYIFLNIAAFPVMIITCRNNLMNFLAKDKIPQSGNKITKWTVLYTAIITIPIITIALLTTNIQLVLDWVSGICGSLLISILPSLFVIQARKIAERIGINHKVGIHKASLSHDRMPYITLGLGSIFLVFTVYNNFKKYTK